MVQIQRFMLTDELKNSAAQAAILATA